MKFTMDKFTDDELTRGTKLAEFICDNYEGIPNVQQYDNIKKMVIGVLDDDSEIIDSNFEFIAEEMRAGFARDLWILWTEDKENGELISWWIATDNS